MYGTSRICGRATLDGTPCQRLVSHGALCGAAHREQAQPNVGVASSTAFSEALPDLDAVLSGEPAVRGSELELVDPAIRVERALAEAREQYRLSAQQAQMDLQANSEAAWRAVGGDASGADYEEVTAGARRTYVDALRDAVRTYTESAAVARAAYLADTGLRPLAGV